MIPFTLTDEEIEISADITPHNQMGSKAPPWEHFVVVARNHSIQDWSN